MSSKKSGPVKTKSEETVRKAKSGDIDAFGELYELIADGLYRYALWYIGNETLAEEAVSDTVCQAFEAIGSLKNAAAFQAWIFRILSNNCKKYLREKIEGRSRIDLDAEETETLLSPSEAPGELWLSVQALPETDREILLLSVLGGYKSAEIGQMLSLPPGTVRSKLSRCIKGLANKLSA